MDPALRSSERLSSRPAATADSREQESAMPASFSRQAATCFGLWAQPPHPSDALGDSHGPGIRWSGPVLRCSSTTSCSGRLVAFKTGVTATWKHHSGAGRDDPTAALERFWHDADHATLLSELAGQCSPAEARRSGVSRELFLASRTAKPRTRLEESTKRNPRRAAGGHQHLAYWSPDQGTLTHRKDQP